MENKYYIEMTMEQCFIKYYEENIACICDGDKKEIMFEEE